jgi:hypothetical protein
MRAGWAQPKDAAMRCATVFLWATTLACRQRCCRGHSVGQVAGGQYRATTNYSNPLSFQKPNYFYVIPGNQLEQINFVLSEVPLIFAISWNNQRSYGIGSVGQGWF